MQQTLCYSPSVELNCCAIALDLLTDPEEKTLGCAWVVDLNLISGTEPGNRPRALHPTAKRPPI